MFGRRGFAMWMRGMTFGVLPLPSHSSSTRRLRRCTPASCSRDSRVPLAATVLQVLIFNPGFPWYLSTTRIVGATPVLVDLHGPEYAPDMEEVSEHVVTHTDKR